MRTLSLFFLVMSICLNSWAADIDGALADFETGRYNSSFKSLKAIEKKKKSNAVLLLLASHYARGVGIGRDFEMARQLLKESEAYSTSKNGCSLNKIATKYYVFAHHLTENALGNSEILSFASSLQSQGFNYGYKVGVCPKVDRDLNIVGY